MEREDMLRTFSTLFRASIVHAICGRSDALRGSLSRLGDVLRERERIVRDAISHLVELGLVELLKQLERSDDVGHVVSEIYDVVDAVFHRGIPRDLVRAGKRQFNRTVRDVKSIIEENGPIDVNERGEFVRYTPSSDGDNQSSPSRRSQDPAREDQKEEPAEKKEKKKKQAMKRTLSMASETALTKLQKLQLELESIQVQVTNIQESLSENGDENDVHLGQFKTTLGILNGRLDKLQFAGLDSVVVGALASGQKDARALRKSLNKRASTLSTLIKNVHSRIGKDLFYRTISQ